MSFIIMQNKPCLLHQQFLLNMKKRYNTFKNSMTMGMATMMEKRRWLHTHYYFYCSNKYNIRRVPSRSMGVVITKVTETVRALTVTRTVNARMHVQYTVVTRILAPCQTDNHP
jgi:hypothetical protein